MGLPSTVSGSMRSSWLSNYRVKSTEFKVNGFWSLAEMMKRLYWGQLCLRVHQTHLSISYDGFFLSIYSIQADLNDLWDWSKQGILKFRFGQLLGKICKLLRESLDLRHYRRASHGQGRVLGGSKGCCERSNLQHQFVDLLKVICGLGGLTMCGSRMPLPRRGALSPMRWKRVIIRMMKRRGYFRRNDGEMKSMEVER